jgi:hypothetical protein
VQDRIPADEVQRVYADVAASMPPSTRARAVSFRSFMAMLRQPSNDSLDLYDDRHDGSISTLKSAALHTGSASQAGGYLSSSGGMHSSLHNSVLGAYVSRSPSSPGESSGVRTLAGSCAAEARRSEGSARKGDASGHRGRGLPTVFEKMHT